MIGLFPLALALALTSPAAAPGVAPEPYRCGIALEVAGLAGGIWRDFYPGRPDDLYIIQLQSPALRSGPFAIWSIDNRPPARPRDYGYLVGRPEAEVFRDGPDSVTFGDVDYGEIRDGPLWARLYGDGLYAGVYLAQTARQTRRAFRAGARGLYLSLDQRLQPAIVARLANASEWQAVLVDAAGRELGRRRVRVPTAQEVRLEFERARARLLQDRDAFLAGETSASATCETFPPEDATI